MPKQSCSYSSYSENKKKKKRDQVRHREKKKKQKEKSLSGGEEQQNKDGEPTGAITFPETTVKNRSGTALPPTRGKKAGIEEKKKG